MIKYLKSLLVYYSMRYTNTPQMKLGEISISKINININSRDDIPTILSMAPKLGWKWPRKRLPEHWSVENFRNHLKL